MGIWDKVNSIANRILPDGEDDRRSAVRAPQVQYDDYGQPVEYEQRYDYDDTQAYEPVPEENDAYFDYETNSGDRYVRAGARPRPQQGQRRNANPFSGLIGRFFGGNRQQQPPPPVREQDYTRRQPPDNVIPMSDFDQPQDDRGGYDDRGRYDERARGRAEPPQGGRYQQPPPPRAEYDDRGRYEEQPAYDDRGGYGDYDNGYYDEAPQRQSHRMRTSSQTMLHVVRRLEEASIIIGHMINGGLVIVNMEDVDEVLKQRMLDMISGAAYALDCSVKQISYRNYFVAPSGEEIVSNMGTHEQRSPEEMGIRGGFRSRESRVQEFDRNRERSSGRDRDWDRERDRDRGRYL